MGGAISRRTTAIESETPNVSGTPPPPPPPPPRTPPPANASDTKDQPPGDPERHDPPSTGEGTAVAGGAESSGGEGAEGEEEPECGFCLFMKSGGCKDSFVAWESCVEEAEATGEDVVGKCSEATLLLNKCMDAHADYYEPILRAEQAMADADEAPDSEEN